MNWRMGTVFRQIVARSTPNRSLKGVQRRILRPVAQDCILLYRGFAIRTRSANAPCLDECNSAIWQQICATRNSVPARKRKGRIFIRPELENKIFSPRCGVADLRLHYTHSNRVLHLTNVNRVSQAPSPASHQYWGQCSN